MFCGNCGREIPDNARFCGSCGSPVTPNNQSPRMRPASETGRASEPRGGYDERNYSGQNYGGNYGSQDNGGGYYGGGDSSGPGALSIMSVIAAAVFAVFAVVYLVMAVGRFASAISSFAHSLSYSPAYGAVWMVKGMIPALLTLLCAAACAVVALAMFACFRGYRRENAKNYFLAAAAGALLAIVAYLLRMIAGALLFEFFGSGMVGFIILLVACAAVIVLYVVLAQSMGIAVLSEINTSDLKGAVSDAIGCVLADIKNSPEAQKAGQWRQEHQAGANAAAGTGYKAAGSPNGAYSYNARQQYGGNQNYQQNNGYRNEQAYGAPGYSAGPMKTDRSTLLYFLLSFVTCGIYGYYVTYTLARDINIVCNGDGKETAGLLKFLLFGFLTCGIYDWYWYYAYANRLQENAPRYGLHFAENGTSVLLWMLIGALLCFIGPIIAMNIMLKNTNALCMAYNKQMGYYG